jgi:transposase-like protein
MPLTQGRVSGTLFLDGLGIHPRYVLLGFPQYLGMEDVPRQLIRGHVLGLLFNFLRHGAPMKEQMDLCQLVEKYGDDTNCRKAIENIRWPDGILCPACGSKKISRIVARNQFDCDSCRYQFSALSGTIFHDTHLPLHKWFLATYLLCESKKGMSALQMQRMLHTTYRTAWYLCHRIRTAMQEMEPKPLGGTVEVDETYVGGKKRRWRPRSIKQVVIGIRQRNGDLRLIRAKDAKSKTVQAIVQANIGAHVEVIMTDESAIYPWALNHMDSGKHKTINHTRGYAHGDVHTNTVESAFSLLKRGIVGTWHKVDAKHLPAYLDEMCFRFNNRKNPYLFRDALKKLVSTPNLEYKELTAKQEEPAA